MISKESKFFQRSVDVAKRFLRSVVLVDDRAYESLDAPPEEVNAPASPEDAALGEVEHAREELEAEGDQDAGDDRAHAFDVRTITRLFAQNDLLATVAPIEVGSRQESRDIVVRLARRADVLVLDWALAGEEGDRGAFAREVLKRVREEDQERGGRLRLAVVYTGDNGLVAIKNRICDAMGIGRGNPTVANVTEGHARYVVLGKPSAGSSDDVAYEALPDRIVREFTELTAGLLSNVALRGFAELRDRTHAVLAQTDHTLDAPYLAHRVHCAPVEAAEDLAVELLVDECASILRNANLQHEVSLDAAHERVIAQEDARFEIAVAEPPSSRVSVSNEDMHTLLRGGVENFEHPSLPKFSGTPPTAWHHEFYTNATAAFGGRMKVRGGNLNERFSVFSMLLTVSAQEPALTLGVLVRETTSTDILLCLQPRCDAVRVPDDGRDYLFVATTPAGSLGFDLVVATARGRYDRVLVRPSPRTLRLIRFKSNGPHRQVRAVPDRDRSVFRDVTNKEYEFLGQLKDGHAQRYANELAAQIARVGVDTFEWLRRSDRSRR